METKTPARPRKDSVILFGLSNKDILLSPVLDLLDCLDLFLLNHLIPMLLSKVSAEEDGDEPSEPYCAEEFDVVLFQLLDKQYGPHRVQPIQSEEQTILGEMSVFVDSGASGQDLVVE